MSLAKGLKLMVKLGRIGVLMKTSLTLLFSYSDLITNALMFLSFRRRGKMELANALGPCIDVSLVLQAILISFQYR